MNVEGNFLVFSLVFVSLLAATSFANAQQFRPFTESKITEAQWQSYHSEVSTKFAKTLRDLGTENLQLFFNEATFVTYTFTILLGLRVWLLLRVKKSRLASMATMLGQKSNLKSSLIVTSCSMSA
jgi:uncharacterized membrane protein